MKYIQNSIFTGFFFLQNTSIPALEYKDDKVGLPQGVDQRDTARATAGKSSEALKERKSGVRVASVDTKARRIRKIRNTSMSAVNLQQQIRDNSRELNDFLRDLNDWTGEVKEKDRALVKKDATVESVSNGTAVNAPPPPVRGRVDAHHVKSEEVVSANRQSAKKKNKRRQSSLKDSEAENETSCSSKDMGNACFNKGDYVTAISHYTRCIEHEEGARAAYANRAMCGIKLGRWTEAEADCTEAIRLEPTFLKARKRVQTRFLSWRLSAVFTL